MQALILAGGKGTRLRPLTVYTPKPIVPICNRPFLLYQIDTLRRAGITDITLSLSYQPNKIEQLLGDGSDFGVKLKYTVEPQPMGTAGAYKFAEDLIREPTVVFNGDILTDLDLKAVIREHSERKATATVVLTPGENYSFEYGLFPDLLKRGEAFYAHIPARTYWIDIGTPERYLRVHHDLLANRVGRMHIKDRRGQFDAATVAEIDELSMIGDDCHIKPGAQIINSVLGQGCFVEERARVENSVIWPHTRIGSNAQLNGAIAGRGCHIGRSAVVGAGTVLGDKSSLTDYTFT